MILNIIYSIILIILFLLLCWFIIWYFFLKDIPFFQELVKDDNDILKNIALNKKWKYKKKD